MREFTAGWVVFAYSLIYGFILLYAISLAIRYRTVSRRLHRKDPS